MRRHFLCAMLLVVALSMSAACAATREAGVALVIGNASYPNDPLPNATRDSAAIGQRLQSLGFAVHTYSNLDAAQMNAVLHEFERRVERGKTGVLYFAGHGMQVGNSTLMLPVDAAPGPLAAMKQGIDLAPVLAALSTSGSARHKLVILDTCLNNPFHTGSLSLPNVPPNVSVAYATAPGHVASDGASHGIFTGELLRHLNNASSINDALRSTAISVNLSTGGLQAPWIASSEHAWPVVRQAAESLASDHASLVRSRGILPKDSDEQYELAFWDSIKDSSYPSDYEAYLKAYPNGRFATLAHARIDRLRAAGASKPDAKATTPATPSTHAVTPPAVAPAPKPPPAATVQAASVTQPIPVSPATKPAPTTGAAHEIKDCPACPSLIALPAGSFSMGSNSDDPAERPVHRVGIAQPFAIGKYEVTVGQWNACVETSGCPRIDMEGDASPNTPVRNVSWDDAQAYVKWLSRTTNNPYRLPTEAEWEYAVRGGTSSTYWWGDKMQKGNADCKECGDPWRADGPVNVGSFAPNPYGLFDMNGSVWEWVGDCWHDSYKGASADGRLWDEAGCPARVIRGGSWRDGAAYMQSSTRFKYSSSVRQSQNGFRVVRDLK